MKEDTQERENEAFEDSVAENVNRQESEGGENPKQKESSIDPDTEESGEIERLKDDLSEAKDKYLRIYSEFENFRRRTAKEKIDLINSANEQLLLALLPISDDFERAERALKDKNDEGAEGFAFIHNKFRRVLESYGVKPMPLEPGAPFDPDAHEAVTQIPAPREEWKGKVVDVIEKGYLLNDKVIRYAKVIVGS